jgi:hypothetical protein
MRVIEDGLNLDIEDLVPTIQACLGTKGSNANNGVRNAETEASDVDDSGRLG